MHNSHRKSNARQETYDPCPFIFAMHAPVCRSERTIRLSAAPVATMRRCFEVGGMGGLTAMHKIDRSCPQSTWRVSPLSRRHTRADFSRAHETTRSPGQSRHEIGERCSSYTQETLNVYLWTEI